MAGVRLFTDPSLRPSAKPVAVLEQIEEITRVHSSNDTVGSSAAGIDSAEERYSWL